MKVSDHMREAADAGLGKYASLSVSRAKSKWGQAWKMLSPEMKAGAIALEAIYLLGGQDTESGKWKVAVDYADAITNVLPIK